MNWLQKIGHGIARAFTIPAKERAQMNASPIASMAKPLIEQRAKEALALTLAANLTPEEAELTSSVLNRAIDMTGAFK